MSCVVNHDSATVTSAERDPQILRPAVRVLGERQLQADGPQARRGGDHDDGHDDALSLVVCRDMGLEVPQRLRAHMRQRQRDEPQAGQIPAHDRPRARLKVGEDERRKDEGHDADGDPARQPWPRCERSEPRPEHGRGSRGRRHVGHSVLREALSSSNERARNNAIAPRLGHGRSPVNVRTSRPWSTGSSSTAVGPINVVANLSMLERDAFWVLPRGCPGSQTW